MTDFAGQTFGRYHILEKLGEGGMATVYKGYDTRLERDVAIKVIRTDLFGAAVLERILKRFGREAKALARLTHPNIVSVIDYGEYEGTPYLVMEYLPGGTLKGILGMPMPWQEAVRILLPIAEALDYAHSQNIIHRDIKPSNILLTQRSQPMLSDFGIAKILESDESLALTGTGIGLGTPEYMAPEQWTGKAGAQSDIYSLGVVLYELVTGRKPYTADTPAAILLKQANDPLPRPKKFVPDLSDGVEKVIIKALAKKPGERYQSMEEFSTALEALRSGQAKTKQPTLPWEKQKAEKIHRPEQATPQVQKRIEDQPTGDIRLSAEGKPREPASPEMPAGVASWRGRSKVRPAWIIALVGLAAVIVFAVWGIPPLAARLERTRMLSTTAKLASAFVPTVTSTHTPTFTLTLELSLMPMITPAATATIGIGSTLTRPADGMVMVYVPAGEYLMGSTNLDTMAHIDEKPPHTVYLNDYWIDRTEVSNAMYAQCVSAGGCKPPYSSFFSTLYNSYNWSYYNNSQYDNYPVIYVNWNDAVLYCNWAGVRLPTEAEWEKTARGTDGRIYPWGNSSPSNDLLNHDSYSPAAVGEYPTGASPYGALDMAGNVWEWVNDWYGDTYYSQSSESNPQGPTSGNHRVLRGGTWNAFDETDVRASLRNGRDPTYSFNDVGFRCARSAP
jgi:eukaryotic-like serine/threonine-protein kinase